MHWLERAYAQKDPLVVPDQIQPAHAESEPDARYKTFLKKMNLPE
jgi:hypothetical protein